MAGSSPFGVRLVATGPDREIQVDGIVEVAGFASVAAHLDPPVIAGRRRGNLVLVVKNEGHGRGPGQHRGPPRGQRRRRHRGPGLHRPRPSDVSGGDGHRGRPAPAGLAAPRHRFQLSVVATVADGAPLAPVVVDGTLRQPPARGLLGVIGVTVALLVGIGGWATRAGPGGTA